MIRNTAKKIYIVLIFIFLYAPIATLMVFFLTRAKPVLNGADLLSSGILHFFRMRISYPHCPTRYRLP